MNLERERERKLWDYGLPYLGSILGDVWQSRNENNLRLSARISTRIKKKKRIFEFLKGKEWKTLQQEVYIEVYR